jgi:hypothetical protein
VFAQAVAAGATVRQPLAEAFWGDLHGQLEDPFGHRWNLSQHLRDVPHHEVVAAAARAFAEMRYRLLGPTGPRSGPGWRCWTTRPGGSRIDGHGVQVFVEVSSQ